MNGYLRYDKINQSIKPITTYAWSRYIPHLWERHSFPTFCFYLVFLINFDHFGGKIVGVINAKLKTLLIIVCPWIVERPCVTKCPECRNFGDFWGFLEINGAFHDSESGSTFTLFWSFNCHFNQPRPPNSIME